MLAIKFQTIESTQDIAKRLQTTLQPSVWQCITAEEQVNGRGTHRRKWISPVGVNIYATFSLLVPNEKKSILFHVSQVAAYAVVETLKSFGFDPKFKWVNDVLLNDKKACGILTETSNLNNAYVGLLIGIGLNVNSKEEIGGGIDQPVTSLFLESDQVFDREVILSRLKIAVEKNITLLLDQGFATFSQLISEGMAWVGEMVTFDTKGQGHESDYVQGTMIGIDKMGKLILQFPQGERVAYLNGRLMRKQLAESLLKKFPCFKPVVTNRDYQNSEKKREVLIYQDLGVSDCSFEETLKWCAMMIDSEKIEIQVVDAEYLKTQSWESKTALLIMPGGRSKPYKKLLGEQGNRKILEYVKSGGCYLGLCAGGYYGASQIIFEKGVNGMEVIEMGPFGFYSGVAEGPAYGLGKFKYQSEAGAQIASVVADKKMFHTYFNGGCWFHSGETSKTEILARYSDLPDQPIAIVSCAVGQGIAILSGVHFEFDERASCLQSNESHQMREILKLSESERMQFGRDILMKLKIPVNYSLPLQGGGLGWG